MPPLDYTIEVVESAPFGQNSYLVGRPDRADLVLVDPGFDTGALLAALERTGRSLAAILNTHGHVDHIAGNAAFKARLPAVPLMIGRDDSRLLTDPQANLSALFGRPLVSPPADRLLDHGERLTLGGLTFEVRTIPGHSPGSVVFVCDAFDPPFVLGGDVLFAGSVGRTDLGGNLAQLVAGIRAHLFDLPAATTVYPGHGPATTVGVEARTNPFAAIR